MDKQEAKIIGAGFGRTGTTSLRKALEILGFGPCYHMHELFANPEHVVNWEQALKGDHYALKELMMPYKAMVDFPACSYYKELYELFPGSKVILFYRDPDEWYDSISNTIFKLDWDKWVSDHPESDYQQRVGRHNKELINHLTFGHLLNDKEFCTEIYLKHIEKIIREIPKSDLLTINLGDKWDRICSFLEVDVPTVPFPYENKRKRFISLVQINKC